MLYFVSTMTLEKIWREKVILFLSKFIPCFHRRLYLYLNVFGAIILIRNYRDKCYRSTSRHWLLIHLTIKLKKKKKMTERYFLFAFRAKFPVHRQTGRNFYNSKSANGVASNVNVIDFIPVNFTRTRVFFFTLIIFIQKETTLKNCRHSNIFLIIF